MAIPRGKNLRIAKYQLLVAHPYESKCHYANDKFALNYFIRWESKTQRAQDNNKTILPLQIKYRNGQVGNQSLNTS